MKNKEILNEMFKIYGKPSVDWMGFEVTNNNPITFHHIKEERSGGKETVDNGALLTKSSHSKLHKIEKSNLELYTEYKYWFRIINDMRCAPTEEVMEVIYSLKKRLKATLEVDRIVKRDAKTYYRVNFR